MFKIHNLPVPNLKTNQTDLLAKFDLNLAALAIDDVHDTYTALSSVELQNCEKQHGNFCPIEKPFYPVATSKACVVQLFQNIREGIDKFCSISVETSSADPDARNLREGKWLIMSSQSLTINVKCGQKVSSKTTNPPIDILTLDLGCSGHHGSLLLPPYYNKETHYNMTNSFQDFLNELQTNSLWEQFNQRFPQKTKYKIPPKLKNIKEFPIDTLLAELPEEQLVSMKTSPWVGSPWFYITIASMGFFLLILIGKLIRNRDKVKKKLSKLGCLRCNKSKGERKEGDGPPERKDPAKIEWIPLETFHEKNQKSSISNTKGKVKRNSLQPSKKVTYKSVNLDKPYRPDYALSQRYLQERKELSATTSSDLKDDRSVLAGATYPSVPPMNLHPSIDQHIPVMYDS